MYLVHLGRTFYHVVAKVSVSTMANAYVKQIVLGIAVSVVVQRIIVVDMVYVIMVPVIVMMGGPVHHVRVIVTKNVLVMVCVLVMMGIVSVMIHT